MIIDDNFSGEYVENTDFGKLIINFVNGKREGILKSFDITGRLIAEIEYKNDMISGYICNYHINGNIALKAEYKENHPNGKMMSFYESGVLQFETNYENGVLNGYTASYDEFGDKIIEFTYKDGLKNGEYTAYFPKTNGGGISEKCFYINDLICGKRITYYPNGEKMTETTYENGRPQTYTKMYTQKGKEIY